MRGDAEKLDRPDRPQFAIEGLQWVQIDDT